MQNDLDETFNVVMNNVDNLTDKSPVYRVTEIAKVTLTSED